MFKEMLIAQFKRNEARYEIEKDTPNEVEIWDREERKSLCFYFDNEGNLIEIF